MKKESRLLEYCFMHRSHEYKLSFRDEEFVVFQIIREYKFNNQITYLPNRWTLFKIEKSDSGEEVIDIQNPLKTGTYVSVLKNLKQCKQEGVESLIKKGEKNYEKIVPDWLTFPEGKFTLRQWAEHNDFHNFVSFRNFVKRSKILDQCLEIVGKVKKHSRGRPEIIYTRKAVENG